MTYFPLRRVKIRNVIPEAGVANPPSDNERVRFSLLLLDFVDYSELATFGWNERVQKFDSRRGIVHGRPSYFMIGGSNSDEFPSSKQSVPKTWEDLVLAVSKSSNFQRAVFLRLDHLRPYVSRQGNRSVQTYEDDRLVYDLRPGSIYKLDLSLFEDTTGSAGESTLEVASSTSELVADRPYQSIVSGLAEKSTHIACKRTIENIIGTLNVRVDQKPPSAHVNSSNPTLFVRISVSRTVLLGFLVCIFLGGLGVSIDPDVVRELCSIQHPAGFALCAKLFGALFLGVAAFLAFRKLPSGDRA